MAAAIAQLSSRLTEALAQVELQRSTLDEVILRLAEQARHLNGVAGVLTTASREQGLVLHELQRLASGGADAHARNSLERASTMLGHATPSSFPHTNGQLPAAPPSASVEADAIAHRERSTSIGSQASQASQATASSTGSRAQSPTPDSAPPSKPPQMRDRSVTVPVRVASMAAPRLPVIEPDMSDDDGIEYVKNLHITGKLAIGSTITAEGEFIGGEPTVRWFRTLNGEELLIDHATSRSRDLTADDLNAILRVECTGPFGGEPVSASTPRAVVMDEASVTELGKIRKKGEAIFPVRSASTSEARTLVLNKEKIKIRHRKKTIFKRDVKPGSIHIQLASFDEATFTLSFDAGPAMSFTAESSHARDVIALATREFLPPGRSPRSATKPEADAESLGSFSQDKASADGESNGGDSDEEYQDHLKNTSVTEGDEEGGEEGESFKPRLELKILPQSEIKIATNEELRATNLSAPPSAPPGRARRSTTALPPPTSSTNFNTPPGSAQRARAQSAAAPRQRPTPCNPSEQDIVDMYYPSESGSRANTPAAASVALSPAASASAGSAVGQPAPAPRPAPPPQSPPSASPPPSASLTVATPSQQPTHSARQVPSGSAAFSVMAIERISATFEGGNLRHYAVTGELLAQQYRGFSEAHSFKMHLANTANVNASSVEANEKLLLRLPESRAGVLTYQVNFPATAAPSGAPPFLQLLRYTAASAFKVRPVKVSHRWSSGPGTERLDLFMEANPVWPQGLVEVVVMVQLRQDVTGCAVSQPAGEWISATKQLIWKHAQLKPATQLRFSAAFATAEGTGTNRTAQPLSVSFVCKGSTLTGLVPTPEPGAPVGKVTSGFRANKYILS